MKKRIGKDFDAVISVQHDGEPINFSQYEVLWVSIDTAYRRTKLKPGTWTTAGGLITAHISRNLISSAGEHWFTVAYRKPDASIEDGYYDFEDNSESFQIVGKTEDEDAGDLTAKVELLAGLTGKAFKYEDFTPEQLSEIKRPIVESAERADLAIAGIKSDVTAFLTNSENILSAQLADNDNKVNQKLLGVDSFVSEKTSEINEKINQTDTAIQNANTATQNANEAAGLANNAATLANEKAGLADASAINAKAKAILANEAATNANNVANTYAAELNQKSGLIVEYIHSGNQVLNMIDFDYTNNIATLSQNHDITETYVYGLCVPLSDDARNFPLSFISRSYYRLYPVEPNKLQIKNSGGADFSLTQSGTDYTKIQIEITPTFLTLNNLSIDFSFRADIIGFGSHAYNYLNIRSATNKVVLINSYSVTPGGVYDSIKTITAHKITDGYLTHDITKIRLISSNQRTISSFENMVRSKFNEAIVSITFNTTSLHNGLIVRIYKL